MNYLIGFILWWIMVAQQLRDVSTSMQNIDREIAGKIGVM